MMRPLVIAALVLVVAVARGEGQSTNSLPSRAVLDKLSDGKSEVFAVDIKRRGDKIVVQTEDKSLEVSNPNTVSTYARHLPVEAKLSLDPQQKVKVQDLSLEATSKWKRAAFRAKADYHRITEAYDRLDAVAKRALGPDAREIDAAALKQEVANVNTAIVTTYAAIPPTDTESQREVLATFRDARRTGKAIYGFDDRYPPQTYQRIYENSRGTLALARGENKPHCSGVLIGRDLALTNYHCVDTFFPNDLNVRFGYEDDLQGAHLPQRVVPVARYVVSSAQDRGDLDFALLELGVDAEGKHAGDLFPPQCLSTARVRRDDPVYLIGHPLEQPRTVHDNAFVYFPFEVTPEGLVELEMLVRSEFDGRPEAAERLTEFRESYREHDTGGQKSYENFSKRFHDQPTIGADCDTFHGNSGSPAYSRRTHRVIGLLFDGMDDEPAPWAPGWGAHEAIIPMTKIVAQLDTTLPDWRTRPGVCPVN